MIFERSFSEESALTAVYEYIDLVLHGTGSQRPRRIQVSDRFFNMGMPGEYCGVPIEANPALDASGLVRLDYRRL